MSTTRDAAISEVKSRGADYLSDTRIGNFLNAAHAEVCNAAFWPFTEATASGAAPLTIADLRLVRYVVDENNDCRLPHRARHWLVEAEGDLSVTGTPRCYYIDSGTVVRTYPAGGTITVAYYKVPTALTNGSDTFLVPDAYMDVVYDATMVRVLKDAGNYAEALQLRSDVAAQLEVMRQALLVNTDGATDYIRVRMPE